MIRSTLKLPGIRQASGNLTVGGSLAIGGDAILVRSAANVLALRNGTAGQSFIVNGSFTDASNYRRAVLSMTPAGAATLNVEGLGTGATGNTLVLNVDGTAALTLNGVLNTGWSIATGATTTYRWSTTRSRMASPANGQINFTDAAGTAFSELQFAGTKVLGVRQTGWGAPTGTLARTTFATSTVTLEQLAQRVAALITDLTTHGLIGV